MILDTQYLILDSGYWILATRNLQPATCNLPLASRNFKPETLNSELLSPNFKL